MKTSAEAPIDDDVDIRVTREELFCDEAKFDGPIPTAKVEEARIESRWLNPAALIIPVIAALIATGSSFLLTVRPLPMKKMWLLIVPLFLAGYAVHAVAYYFRTRRHIVKLTAPSLRTQPIDFYVTESASEASGLLDKIHAALKQKKGDPVGTDNDGAAPHRR
jgi:hypothetical protein